MSGPEWEGYGITVIKGTRRQRFTVEVLGVLKNHNPGRDMVLARMGGLGLEKTGVISGMSGSPVYIDDRLLGAVAYTWPVRHRADRWWYHALCGDGRVLRLSQKGRRSGDGRSGSFAPRRSRSRY